MMSLTTLSLVVPADHDDKYGRILTMNALNNTHHRVYANIRARWRQAFYEAAADQPVVPFTWADITIDHIKPTKRSVDHGACYPVAKAGLDGIVEAGVLHDDKPPFVRSLHFNTPDFQPGVEAIVITLVGELA